MLIFQVTYFEELSLQSKINIKVFNRNTAPLSINLFCVLLTSCKLEIHMQLLYNPNLHQNLSISRSDYSKITTKLLFLPLVLQNNSVPSTYRKHSFSRSPKQLLTSLLPQVPSPLSNRPTLHFLAMVYKILFP